MGDDLDNFAVRVSGGPDRVDVAGGDLAAAACDLDSEADGGICPGVGRSAGAVGGDFRIVQLGDILADIGMRRDAVTAAIDLGNRQGNTLACRRRQLTPGKRAVEAKITLKQKRQKLSLLPLP